MGAEQSSSTSSVASNRAPTPEQSEKMSLKSGGKYNPDTGTVKTSKRRSVIEFFTKNISRPATSSLSASDVCSSHKKDEKLQKKQSRGEIRKGLGRGFDALGEEDAMSAEMGKNGEQHNLYFFIPIFILIDFSSFFLLFY